MQPPHNLQRQATLWSNRPAPSKQQRQAHCSQTKTPIPTLQPTKTGNTVKQSQQPTGPGILWSNWPSNLQGLAYCGQSLKKYPATYKNWHTVVKPTQQVTRTAHCGQTDPAAYNRHAGKMGRYLPGGRVGTWWMSAHCNQESWETVLWHHVLAGSEQLCLKTPAAMLKAQRKKKEKKANTKKNTICCLA